MLFVCGLVAAVPAGLAAQAVPETSQAARLDLALRRWPHAGVDPFRHVFWPRWGLAMQVGAMGGNNTLNAEDVGALLLLDDRDSLLIGDIVDAFGLVPQGQGVRGLAAGEGGIHFGGPLGGSLSIGVSAQGRGYGTFHIDDDAVRFFRDGNVVNQQFPIGETDGTTLVTAEGGAHLLLHAGPLDSQDGPRVTLGFGGRYLRPIRYARGALETNSSVTITDSSIAANITVDTWNPVEAWDPIVKSGSGIAADLLVRMAWPTSGFALEAMVANIGKVTVNDLVHRQLSFNVNTTSLQEVSDSLDAATFDTLGVAESVEVTLPRIVRFAASGWANRILQLDIATTLPVEGEFDQPLQVELGSTWRFLNSLPLRAGVVLGAHQGIGYTGGFGLETPNLLFRVTGSSLGGWFRGAKGAAGRFELGFFF
jgi:hypothetical protein